MARLTDRQFLKAQIDLEPLGLIMDDPFEAYFCTPKGARIFARSGVDGIHFCFVRGFGETVFAVSPMRTLKTACIRWQMSFRVFAAAAGAARCGGNRAGVAVERGAAGGV